MDDAGIEELLDELAERIEQSKPVLGNSQKRQVEIGPIFEILDEIRDIFPEELRQARIIVRDRQGMIEAAEIDANRILEDASVRPSILPASRRSCASPSSALRRSSTMPWPASARCASVPRTTPIRSSPISRRISITFSRTSRVAVSA